MEVENNLKLIKNDHNAAWEIYKEPLIKLCHYVAYQRNLDVNDLFGYAYIKFDEACVRYNPNYNGKFKDFAAYSYGYIEQWLRAYAQRWYICKNRTHPTDFFIHDSDEGDFKNDIIDTTDDYKNVEDKMFVEYIFSFMNKEEKQIFDMYFFKNMKQQQIAKIMGIAQSQVCLVKNNFIKLIRAMFEAQEINDKKTIEKLNKTILFRKRSNITRAKNK